MVLSADARAPTDHLAVALHVSGAQVPSPATMPAALRRAAEQHGDTDAIADYATTPGEPDSVHVTYRELAAQAEEVTRALLAAGIQTGDTVAIWGHNIREWVVAATGIHGAGGVVVPLNTRFKGFEAFDVLTRSHAKLLFAVEEFVGNRYLDMLRAEAGDRPLPPIVILRGDPVEGTASWTDFLATGASITPEAAQARAASVAPTDLCDILFTSGTTGRSKGVMVTHEQTTTVFTTWANTVGLRAGDRMLLVNPFFHSFGYKAGISRVHPDGRHDRARAGVRRRSRAGPHRERADHRLPRAADGVPLDPQPSGPRAATTCRRCASPSPVRPRCRWR